MFVATTVITNPATAQCQVGWLSSSAVQHSNPSVICRVYAQTVLPNGDLVAGGRFDSIGGVSANNIARWDGTTWHPLGGGIPAGTVSALAVLPNGDLVAGGTFTIAGTASVSNLALWDGQAWSQYGGGLTTWVRGLATRPNGNLIALESAASAAHLKEWSGFNWSTIGTATMGGVTPRVNAITVLPNGAVVAAGYFTSIGGISVPDGIAVWNGASWSSMGTTLAGGEVTSLAVMPTGDLIAGMWVLGGIGNGVSHHVQRWDGVTWYSLGILQEGPLPIFTTGVRALTALADGRLVVAGQFSSVSGVPTTDGFAIWDGTGWSSMVSGRPFGVDVNTLAATPGGFLFAGGLATVGRWGCRASGTRFGAGCYMLADTFYEAFPAPPPNFDLGQSTLRMVQTPSGYTVTPIAGAPTFVTPTAPNLMLGDDAVTGTIQLPFQIPYPGGTTNQIVIGSNGYVFLQPSTSVVYYSGSTQPLLNDAPRHAALWCDLDPTSGVGTVHCDIDTTTQTVYATWLNVAEWNAPSAISTFQIAMSANGTVEYRYQNCATSAVPALTGWSPGNGAVDRGGRDISAGGTFQTGNPPGVMPLEHDATSLPALGSTATLTTTNIPAGVPFGATVLSWTRHDPGLDLGNMGMPGCRQYVGLDVVAAFVPVGASASHTFAVPNMTALLGAHVFTQGIVFAPGVNALGALTSNGVDLHFGWQ